MKSVQNENGALRDYVEQLQSRLLEVHGDFPQPQAGLNLSHPAGASHVGQAPMSTETAPQDHGIDNAGPGSGTALEAEAVAVAGLAAQEQMAAAENPRYPSPGYQGDDGGDDTRSADEINRHLSAGEGGAGQPQAV